MRQLTWRAVLMGASLLGAVLSLTNLYIGLKAGWGFGVAITACILSYAIIGGLVGVVLTLLARIFPRHQHLIPSPAGVGLAWTFHWYYGVLFFLGGALGWWVERKYPAWSAEFTFRVASGGSRARA